MMDSEEFPDSSVNRVKGDVEDNRTENVVIVGSNQSLPLDSPAVEGTSRWYTAVFIVINAGLGAGLLNFPASYDKAGGILIGSSVHFALVTFVIVSLLILSYCADLNRSETYQDIVEFTTGKIGKVFCAALITIYCYGTCITFFIIIGDQLDRVFNFAYGPEFCHTWYLNRSFTVSSSSFLLILPLCFSKKIDFLKYASVGGVFSSLYVVALIVVEYFHKDPGREVGPIRKEPSSWTGTFGVIPVICFSYQCHVSAIPVYACLKPRKLKEFTKTIISAILTLFLAYSVAAVFGYSTFGEKTASDILVNYSAGYKPAMAGMIMVALKTYSTYPILFFCARLAIDDLLPLAGLSPCSSSLLGRVVQAVLWFTSSLILAIEIPNIGEVIGILGSLASAFIFIFPGVCLLQRVFLRDPIFFRTKYKILLIISIVFIVFGTFIFGVVVVQAVIGDLHPGHSVHAISAGVSCSHP